MIFFTHAERSDRHLALRRPEKGAHTVREYVWDDQCTRARSAGQNKPSRLRAGTLHVASEQTSVRSEHGRRGKRPRGSPGRPDGWPPRRGGMPEGPARRPACGGGARRPLDGADGAGDATGRAQGGRKVGVEVRSRSRGVGNLFIWSAIHSIILEVINVHPKTCRSRTVN